MPTTVRALFASVGLSAHGPVKFGEPADSQNSGVYVVSDVSHAGETMDREPRIDLGRLAEWRKRASLMTIKATGERPTVGDLAHVVQSWWLPDEPVLYIGRTEQPLSKRTHDFSKTPIGARRPHRGGFWLHALSQPLHVFWSETNSPTAIEERLLAAFANSASPSSIARLPNEQFVMPWANLEWPKGRHKPHGLARQVI